MMPLWYRLASFGLLQQWLEGGYGEGHAVEDVPHAEKVAPGVVVEVATTGVGDVDAPIVVAVDGDDVQSGGEQIGAFVLLHPGGVAEVAEPGHERHHGVES